MFPRSIFVDWNIADWLVHREEMIEAKKRQLVRQVADRQELSRLRSLGLPDGLPRSKPAFYGKVFPENLSAVLAKPTIWCQAWKVPWRPNAPWPFLKEMKWEGDERAATHNGRFLPLPREPSTELNFNHIPMMKAFELDEVWRIPTLEDVIAPVDEIEEHEIPNSFIKELLDEINNIDIY